MTPLRRFSKIAELRDHLAQIRKELRPVVLVPTMGALHEGHLELMRRAKAGRGLEPGAEPYLVISIFVNPTQFGPGEDYRAYPRDTEGDEQKAAAAGVECIFSPEVEEMYPPGDSTFVEVEGPSQGMCGAHRPGHFRGVATVVAKLLNIVQPDAAYFGEKDYQQLKVIERLVRDLHLPVEIVPVPTVREPDGLAMSSRNAYLSPEERAAARKLYAGLSAAVELARSGETVAAALIEAVRKVVADEPVAKLEYVELRDAKTLEALEALDRKGVLALAARVGRARLIDNVLLMPEIPVNEAGT